MGKKLRTFLIWLLLVLGFYFVYLMEHHNVPRETLAKFRQDVEANVVREVWYEDTDHFQAEVSSPHGYRYEVHGSLGDDELLKTLDEHDVPITWQNPSAGIVKDILASVIPLLIIVGVFFYLLRRSAGGKNVLALRKANARVIPESSKVTFGDVGGCEEAKTQLRDVINFLKDSSTWQRAGVRLPRGILLQGPPGCGKSLLARAVAGETKAKFLYMAASEFCEMFIGVGAARVRDLFEQAKKGAPCVIFIDELDSVGRRRGSGSSSLTNDEREQTLNQLLVCMDGLETHERVVVMAATNRPDILDRALLRTGRFDRIIQIPSLSREARQAVFGIHCRGKQLNPSASLEALADLTLGKTGAEIETLCNEAGILAVRRCLQGTNGAEPKIELTDFKEALKHLNARSAKFNDLDLLLIESHSQLSEPAGATRAKVKMEDGTEVVGDILWADASFIKLSKPDSTETVLLAKKQVHAIELNLEEKLPTAR